MSNFAGLIGVLCLGAACLLMVVLLGAGIYYFTRRKQADAQKPVEIATVVTAPSYPQPNVTQPAEEHPGGHPIATTPVVDVTTEDLPSEPPAAPETGEPGDRREDLS